MNKSGPILRPRLYKIAHNARSSRRARDEVMSKEPSVWDQHTFWRKLVLPKKGTREPTSGSVRLQGLRTGQRKTPPWASVVVPAPFAKPVSSGAAGATLGSKRRGRSRSNLSDYALDNRPSTGGGEWATGCFPNASSAHWFLRLVDRKKAPTEPRLLDGRGSRR
jgi:hypothetical protein